MLIPVIVGPTCIGKTSLALEIAKKTNSDILSIDSRQVFKKLDIGTGKFKDDIQVKKYNGYWEVDGVKIWGYDIFDLNEELNVIKFCNFAKDIILKYKSENKKIIATCGTGFYLDFLMGNIFYNDVSEERKKELQNKSIEDLLLILNGFKNVPEIDKKNKLRVITAILNIESKSEKNNFMIEGIEFVLFHLSDKRENLYTNADNFVESIFQQDIVEEYQNLFSEFGKVRSLEGLIYKDISKIINLSVSQEEVKSIIKFSLHHYIKRQETYFKKFKFYLSTSDRKEVFENIVNIL